MASRTRSRSKLSAYYDRSCDSSALFEDLEIATDPTYEEYRNRYDVLYLDMTNILGEAANGDIVSFIIKKQEDSHFCKW